MQCNTHLGLTSRPGFGLLRSMQDGFSSGNLSVIGKPSPWLKNCVFVLEDTAYSARLVYERCEVRHMDRSVFVTRVSNYPSVVCSDAVVWIKSLHIVRCLAHLSKPNKLFLCPFLTSQLFCYISHTMTQYIVSLSFIHIVSPSLFYTHTHTHTHAHTQTHT